MPESGKHGLPVLAIDLGGIQIRAALISDSGQVLARECHLTMSDGGPQSIIGRIFLATDRLLGSGNIDSAQVGSICIAVAGAIDMEKGVVTSSPNLPGWHDVPLRDIVKEKYRVNTFLLNDASAAALGEQHFGVGRGVNNLVYLTVSTGIGGGIIINGELYSGASGSAEEIGHMAIDVDGPRCSCGNTGCLEMLASGTAVAEEAIKRISQGEKSSIIELVDGQMENITAEQVGMAAQGGDSLASEVVLEAATYLGIGMANLVNIFNTEMLIVGGGMAKMGDLLLEPARQVVMQRAFSLPAQAVRIVSAWLGDDVGMLGAAVLVRSENHGRRAG